MANVLANLATTLAPRVEQSIIVLVCGQWVITSPEDENEKDDKTVSIYEIDKEDCHQPLIYYFEHGKLPIKLRHKQKFDKDLCVVLYYKGTLHRCSFFVL